MQPCKNYQMDWNNLNVLATISREGSLAGAARALGVNHATISRRLAALEEEIGAKLVRRLARSTPLTEKGREIAALALEMEDRARTIQRMTKLQPDGVSGTVRLSAPPALLSETLMPELVTISAAHPGLRLALVADARMTSIEQGEADLAIRLTEPLSPQSIARRLGKISYRLYGAAHHNDQSKEAWRFIGAGQEMAQTPSQKWLVDFAAGRPFALVSNDIHVQKSAAEQGLGIALLPDRIALTSPHLVPVDAPKPPALDAWLVMHRDVQNAPATRVVVDAILNVFRSAGDRA